MFLVKPLVISERPNSPGLGLILLVAIALDTVDFPRSVDFWVGPAIGHLPYFVVGVIIGKNYSGLKVRVRGGIISAVIFLSILAFVPQLYRIGVPYLVTATLLSLGVLAVFAWMGDRGGWLSQGLAYTGKRSMAIFLAHVIFAAGIREVLLKFSIDGVGIQLLVGMAAGVLLPIMLNELAIRLKLVKILGF